MRTLRPILLVAAVAGAAALSFAANAYAQKKPQVLVLGTYHLANPGRDYVNPEVDDVLSPRRQREIADLVERLEAFRPTKIAVEVPVSMDSALNARYAAYVAGRDTLRRSEVDQIGFRLARRLGHPRVYPIDHRLDLAFEETIAWAATNGLTEIVERIQMETRKLLDDAQRTLRGGTLAEILLDANSPRADSLHGLYLVAAQIGRDTAYPGAEMVADWYERNLKIFVNIARLVESPDERILVIIGSGHGTLLRQFVREHPDMELVPLDDVLRAPGHAPAPPAALDRSRPNG
jgi:hypothetical protein